MALCDFSVSEMVEELKRRFSDMVLFGTGRSWGQPDVKVSKGNRHTLIGMATVMITELQSEEEPWTGTWTFPGSSSSQENTNLFREGFLECREFGDTLITRNGDVVNKPGDPDKIVRHPLDKTICYVPCTVLYLVRYPEEPQGEGEMRVCVKGESNITVSQSEVFRVPG